MKIVYATDQYWPCVSGVSVSIDSFCREIGAMGHEIHILAPSYGADDPLPPQPGHVHRFRSKKVFFNDENRLVSRSERRSIHGLLDEISPDIVHVQTEFAMRSMAVSWASSNRVPVVMSAHTNWADLIRIYLPWIPNGISHILCHLKMFTAFRKADAIVVPTALMDTLIASYWIRQPMRIIPTGIDGDHFASEPGELDRLRARILASHPQLREGPILLSVGRLGTEKNIPFLVDVLERSLPARPDLKLVIAGDGPARSDLEELVRSRGLERQILFVGFVPHDQLKGFYSLADVFVFASKVESQGLVVLEAMRCGLPVVAIGKMGTREVMGGSNGGFMVDDDMDEFLASVAALLDDQDLREAKRMEALVHASKWTMHAQAEKMERFYRLVLRWKSMRG
jgi:1,2-diacylglycerol 3-alpha-glucosyltransferase